MYCISYGVSCYSYLFIAQEHCIDAWGRFHLCYEKEEEVLLCTILPVLLCHGFLVKSYNLMYALITFCLHRLLYIILRVIVLMYGKFDTCFDMIKQSRANFMVMKWSRKNFASQTFEPSSKSFYRAYVSDYPLVKAGHDSPFQNWLAQFKTAQPLFV